MSGSGPRTGEADLTCPVLRILDSAPGKALNTTELKSAIRASVSLFPGDLAYSITRSDQLIDQIVRNIVSHRTTSGNIISDGLATYDDSVRPGILRLTPAGEHYLSTNCP